MSADNRPRVLVTLPIFPEVVQALAAHAQVDAVDEPLVDRAELARRAANADGLFVANGQPIDADLLAACPKLKIVASMAVGYDNIDVPACTAAGVMASNAPDVLTETTADMGFALMMAAARRISEAEHELREGRWSRWRYDMLAGRDIHGATLGILGMGRIGGAIARRGALGFGMKVIYHNRRPRPVAETRESGARWVDLLTLLRESDHLVCVLPYSPQTHHLIGEAQLAQMKPTATLVNVGRGGVVDDAALARALQEGRLFAAGLDVFEGEPKVNPALLACRNVVLTPHIASASLATRRAMADLAVRNLLAGLGIGPDAGAPPTLLNPEVRAKA